MAQMRCRECGEPCQNCAVWVDPSEIQSVQEILQRRVRDSLIRDFGTVREAVQVFRDVDGNTHRVPIIEAIASQQARAGYVD